MPYLSGNIFTYSNMMTTSIVSSRMTSGEVVVVAFSGYDVSGVWLSSLHKSSFLFSQPSLRDSYYDSLHFTDEQTET